MSTPGLVWLRDQRAAAEADQPRRGGGRRHPLTRPAVVSGAVQMLDAGGLAALSVRALAGHLSTSPASLYWHVADKEEILDLVFDEALGEVVLDPGPAAGPSWQDEVRRLAGELAALSARHPWWPQLYSTRPSIGPRALELSEHLLRTLRRAGFTGLGLDNAETAFYDVVVGHVLIATTWQTWLSRTSHDVAQTQDYLREAVRAHPTVEAHVAELFAVADRDAAEQRRLDFVVDVLVRGLEALRTTQTSPAPSPTPGTDA